MPSVRVRVVWAIVLTHRKAPRRAYTPYLEPVSAYSVVCPSSGLAQQDPETPIAQTSPPARLPTVPPSI